MRHGSVRPSLSQALAPEGGLPPVQRLQLVIAANQPSFCGLGRPEMDADANWLATPDWVQCRVCPGLRAAGHCLRPGVLPPRDTGMAGWQMLDLLARAAAVPIERREQLAAIPLWDKSTRVSSRSAQQRQPDSTALAPRQRQGCASYLGQVIPSNSLIVPYSHPPE